MYPRVEKIKTIEELKLVIEEGKKTITTCLTQLTLLKKAMK